MSKLAISAKELSKRYRIGKDRSRSLPRPSVIHRLAGTFGHLSTTLRKPDAEEVLWALHNVSFEVEEGAVVGLVGKNGSGKSTLLKILSRITEPTSGRARIRGRVGSLLEVGTGFHPELTGRENVYLSGTILGMKRAEINQKFDEIVEFSEIQRFLDTPVKRYSSGMYVRLAFAVAAHLEPEVLLVDEVLAVGDAAFQKRCLGKMGDVAKGGRTVLFVSHNMAAITQLCTSTIWLENGLLRMIGNTDDVVQHYLAQGNTLLPERKWIMAHAPGDDRVRLLAARILQNQHPSPVIDINRAFTIEIDFTVLRNAHNLITGISLYNTQGHCLTNSCDWRPNDLVPGRYTKKVHFPAHLLAEGMISVLVQLVFFEPDIPSVVLPETLRFEAVDSAHPLSVRGHYKSTWPGIMRIHLEWDDAVIQGTSGLT